MNIRPYLADKDFEKLKNWITDERVHALWCAYRVPYPLTREAFDELLAKEEAEYNNSAYIAESDEGEPIGFYCVSETTDAAMLKFVITAPEIRGKGFGTQMASLAAEREFTSRKLGTVRLCVFDCNTAAIKCYTKAGFVEKPFAPGAFRYKDETWGRIVMEINR